jgi:hypothetical protein
VNVQKINGVKVFSATQREYREVLGERVTEWIESHSAFEIVEMRVTQSSDHEFHCIAITVFYFDAAAAARIIPAARPTTTARAVAR